MNLAYLSWPHVTDTYIPLRISTTLSSFSLSVCVCAVAGVSLQSEAAQPAWSGGVHLCSDLPTLQALLSSKVHGTVSSSHVCHVVVKQPRCEDVCDIMQMRHQCSGLLWCTIPYHYQEAKSGNGYPSILLCGPPQTRGLLPVLMYGCNSMDWWHYSKILLCNAQFAPCYILLPEWFHFLGVSRTVT